MLANVRRALLVLFACTLLVSCDRQSRITKNFVWDEDVKELIGGNLHSWLRKAPFDNELMKAEDGKIILTNAEQVFPFMGRFYNAVEELRKDHDADTVIFYDTEVLYQDPVWGDLFLHASLLYEKQEVFLSDSYIEMGSPFFGGTDAVTDMHRSSLSETSVAANQAEYKTGIYWVWTNYQDYLLGFYQQGQLVFETAIPLLGLDTLATLNKLKEVNKSLGLNIPEWEQAEVAHLQVVETPTSFWQDPFWGIYPGSFGNDVYLKTKDTPFVQDDVARKGDYYFSYDSPGGEVYLYTSMAQTELEKEDFIKTHSKMEKYRYSYDDIFYEEHPDNGFVRGSAKTYFKPNQYLALHFSYPETDREARKQVHDVLRHVKTLHLESYD